MYQANLGDLYLRLERVEEAQERYLRACELLETQVVEDPENPALLMELADYSAKANDCGRATRLTSQLEDLLPDTGPNAHRLAYVYAQCGEEDAAVEALAKAIALGESPELIRQEDEFRALHGRSDFQALIGE